MANPVLLRTDALTRRFNVGSEVVTALRDVTILTRESELVAVMGPSGSGKTTLLHLLGGIDRPSDGHVYWRDRDLGEMKEEERNRLRLLEIGLVFQDACLMSGLSALDNALLPLVVSGRRSEGPRVRKLLERVGLNSYLGRFPGQLSRGERQRVAIARALANAPACLLADEPTGNLDRNSTIQTFRIFQELCRTDRLAVVVATHDETILDFASRVIRLSDGQVAGEGAL